MAVIVASRGRGTVGSASSGQGCCVKVSNGRPTGSGECNVRSTSLYTRSTVSCGEVKLRSTCLPRGLLAKKKVRVPDAKSDLMSRLSDVAIAKWLEG
jgi:hypothetical protein